MVRSHKPFFAGTLFLALAMSTFAMPLDETIIATDKPIVTVTGKKACDDCEAIFSKVDSIVNDKRLIGNTIHMVEELVCDRLPEEGQAKCNSTMEEKIPAIFNGIAMRWLNPDVDCRQLGFCRDESMSIGDAHSNDLKCDLCTKITDFIGNNVLQSQKVTDFVTEELDMACEVLPKSYSGLCETAANASVPEILSYAATFIESNGCTVTGFCKNEIIEVPDMWDEFREFMAEFGKVYKTAMEFTTRFEVFCENLHFIEKHTTPTLRLKMNKYGDMTPTEFGVEKKDGCFLETGIESQMGCKLFVANESLATPVSVDWRTKGAVTPVKNQGHCGSCWSFSATGAMEGAYFIKNGKLLSLSEQELVDCSGSFGNMGCNGGVMDNAFEFALEDGMCSEAEEPYHARGARCEKCDSVASFEGCYDVPNNDEESLMKAVAQQPVSVAIEADHNVFMFYQGGIIDDVDCGESLDHGVLAVGYGEENGKKFWIVKNSWGEEWGENGYVRIARDETKKGAGVCGIAAQPSFIVA